MKKNYQILYFCLLVIILSSCFTQKPVYKMNLNNAYKIQNENYSELKTDTFNIEDSLVKVSFVLNDLNQFFEITVKNKTENEIITIWKDAKFIINNDTVKCMIIPINDLEEKFYKNVSEQKSDTIQKWRRINNVYPLTNIYWLNHYNRSGTWKVKELITYPNQTLFFLLPIQFNNEKVIYKIDFTAEFLKYESVYDPIATQKLLNTIGIIINSAYILTYLLIFL